MLPRASIQIAIVGVWLQRCAGAVSCHQVWQALFLVATADSLLRLSSMAPKLLLVAALKQKTMASAIAQHRQGRMLTFVEHLVGAYRAMVPLPVW